MIEILVQEMEASRTCPNLFHDTVMIICDSHNRESFWRNASVGTAFVSTADAHEAYSIFPVASQVQITEREHRIVARRREAKPQLLTHPG